MPLRGTSGDENERGGGYAVRDLVRGVRSSHTVL
jgi:hypothetical protein